MLFMMALLGSSLFDCFWRGWILFLQIKMTMITFSQKNAAVENTIEEFVGFLLHDHSR